MRVSYIKHEDPLPVATELRRCMSFLKRKVVRHGVVLAAFLLPLMPLAAQQEGRITTPEITIDNNLITIRYDINGCTENDRYNVSLVITRNNGSEIEPNQLRGVGAHYCGQGKVIVWDLAQETSTFDEELSFQIVAEKIEVTPAAVLPEVTGSQYSRGGVMMSSLVVPGLGQKRVTGDGGALFMAPLFYGSGAAALFMHFSSQNYYEQYRTAPSAADRDEYFQIAEARNRNAKILLAGAAGVMAVNLVWSAVMPLNTRYSPLAITATHEKGVWQTGIKYVF